MRKHALAIGLLMSAAAAPGVSLAELRYTDFEVSLIDVELDGPGSVDGDGLEIAGSYELNERLFLFGDWQEQDLDFGIDGRAIEIGAGLHHALNPSLDFVGTVSYVDQEVEFQGFSGDDSGLALGGGVRSRIDSFELEAMLKLVDFDDSGSDTGVLLGGRYYFTDTMAVSVGMDMTDNADTMRVGFRAEF
jgi:hypothetical protein